MPELTEEEKEILRRAYEIKERIRAEELEAGEITVEEMYEKRPAVRKPRTKVTAQASDEPEITDHTQFRRPQEAQKDDEAYRMDPAALKQVLQEEKQEEKRRTRQKQFQENEQKLQSRKKRLQEEEEQLQLRQQRQQLKEQEDQEKQLRQRKKQLKKKERDYRQTRKQGAKEGSGANQPRRKKKGFLHKLLIFLLSFLVAVLALLIAAFFFIRSMAAKTDYRPYETGYVRQADVLSEKGVTNILLIGTDTRVPGSDDTRSDAMIVLSINPHRHRLVMTSILRDSYVNIPGHGQNRINEAYSWGGAPLLIQTIEENYKLGIDYYVQVDFFDFVDVIDAFGGVSLTVAFEELPWVNGYVSEYNHIIGAPEGDQFLDTALFTDPEPVLQRELTLTGRQALGYCRIRKIGTDFARTQRQRTVMNALLGKVKKAGPFQIYRAIDSVLPDLCTNISDKEMCSFLLQALFCLSYDTVQARVPADGTWSNAIMGTNQEVLAVDFAANRAYLQATIYD